MPGLKTPLTCTKLFLICKILFNQYIQIQQYLRSTVAFFSSLLVKTAQTCLVVFEAGSFSPLPRVTSIPICHWPCTQTNWLLVTRLLSRRHPGGHLFSRCLVWKNYHPAKMFNPLTPMLALTSRDEPWPFFHFWRYHFDQNWHHLCSTSAGREDISSDAQIRVIGQLEPEICTKMLKTWSKKLRPKFPATTPGCSMVKVARLNDAFLEVF